MFLFDIEPTLGFLVFLVITLAFLGAVVFTGFKAKRPIHLTLVVFAVASLGITIYYAERLGTLYDLDSAGWIYPVHLAIAKTTTCAYLLPVITGVMTLRNPIRKTIHRRVAYTVLTLTVLTAVTGTWMVLASNPL
ncbi:MAG: hypothetical protein ACI8TQ_003716 [Planctomycetota bacterium]|jgi:hypothetical protein